MEWPKTSEIEALLVRLARRLPVRPVDITNAVASVIMQERTSVERPIERLLGIDGCRLVPEEKATVRTLLYALGYDPNEYAIDVYEEIIRRCHHQWPPGIFSSRYEL